MPALIDRCGVIAGAGQFGRVDQGVFTLWVAHHHFGLPLRYLGYGGSGKQVRDLLYVDDLLDAFDLAVGRIDRSAGRAYNVGGGASLSSSIWREFREPLADVAGAEPRARFAPWRPADQRVYVSDIRRAEAELGWRPLTALCDGLRALRDWLVLHDGRTRGDG